MSIPLQKDRESQSHLTELSENGKMGDIPWGERQEKEGQSEELVGEQNPSPEAPPRSKIGREKRGQRRCQGRSDGEMSGSLRKEVRRDDSIKCFVFTWVGSTF